MLKVGAGEQTASRAVWQRAIDRVPRRMSRDILLRVAADVIMVNAALIAALAIRFFWLVSVQTSAPFRTYFYSYAGAYARSAPVLTVVCIGVFAVSGFYTRSRAYRGRYKAIVVTQAVSIAYLVFGFAAFLLSDRFNLPRAALIMGWLFTVAALVGSRLWSAMWRAVVKAEHHDPVPPQERKITRVLVIGGDGYIGSALIGSLLDRGYRVRILSLLLYGTEPIQQYLNHPRLQIVHADFRQVDKVVEAMRDVDAVVHLGAIVGDPACALDADLTIDVNVMATRMIAEVAKGHGVNRFIFASTCSVYGAGSEILDEHSALNPVSLYAQSKIACEQVLKALADDDFSPVMLRFGTIFGLSGRMRFDLVVNLLTAKAVEEGQITIAGGAQWRPFVHVEDAARAVQLALEAPLTLVKSQVYNVGSDEQNFTIDQVGQIVNQAVPEAIIRDIDAGGDRRDYRVSFRKIRTELGFVPKWTVEQGVQQVIEALRSGRVGDYQDARYSNAKFLAEEGMSFFPPSASRWMDEVIGATLPDNVGRPRPTSPVTTRAG